jgi:hypothetical protein
MRSDELDETDNDGTVMLGRSSDVLISLRFGNLMPRHSFRFLMLHSAAMIPPGASNRIGMDFFQPMAHDANSHTAFGPLNGVDTRHRLPTPSACNNTHARSPCHPRITRSGMCFDRFVFMPSPVPSSRVE